MLPLYKEHRGLGILSNVPKVAEPAVGRAGRRQVSWPPGSDARSALPFKDSSQTGCLLRPQK